MFVSDVCQSFLCHCQSAITLSKHTLRAYAGDIKNIEAYFGSEKLFGMIDKDDLRNYIRYLREERHFKETSIKRRIACFKLVFRWALQESLIDLNPFDKLNDRIRLPKSLPRSLDRNHAQLLRSSVSNARRVNDFCVICSKTAIHLLLETGIRIGELTKIRVEDVSLSDRRIHIQGKGNRQRIVYFLSAPLYRSLDRYLSKRNEIASEVEMFFITASGRSVTQQEIRSSLCDFAIGAGIDRHVTPHMLRHTCATHWLESGLDIRFVQKLLGHHSISTTEIYTHVTDMGLREALKRAEGKMR